VAPEEEGDEPTITPVPVAGGITDLFSNAYLYRRATYTYISSMFFQIDSPTIGSSYLSGDYVNFAISPQSYYMNGDQTVSLFRETSIIYMGGTVPVVAGDDYDQMLYADGHLMTDGTINTLQDRVNTLQDRMDDLSFAFDQPEFLERATVLVDARIAEVTDPQFAEMAQQIADLTNIVNTLTNQINPILLQNIAKALRLPGTSSVNM